jgi:CSLREA domain-containing protein
MNSKPDNYVHLISKAGLALLFVALSLWNVCTLLAVNVLGPVVDTALDENDGECVVDCSLRDAIQLVGSGDTITFAADYSIYLSSTLQITKSLIIDGSGHTITISGDTGNDGSRNVQVFNIGAGNAVTLSYLNVVSGTATNGAGIYNNGSLIVNNSTIRDNVTASNDGGGIYNGAALVVNHSTIRDNQGRDGGGIYGEGVNGNTTTINDSSIYNNTATRYGGGVHNNGGNAELTLTNSTLSGNHANTLGGGFADGINAVTTIQFSTIVSNTAPSGGGGLDLFLSTTNIGASIIAYNSGSPNNVATFQATLNSLGYNLEDRNDAGFSAVGDQTSTDPLLLPLADYDGETQSHLPQTSSPAVDAIPD